MDTAGASSHGAVPDRGPAVFAVTIATLVLSSFFVASRMVCRYFIVKRITWDDRLMVLAWLFAFFLSFTICFGVVNGLGKHDKDISTQQVPLLRHCEYVFSILYNPALMATKTSILIFYLRLARDTQVVLRIASWATLAVVNVAGTILTLMNVFQCRPTQAAYDSNFHGVTKCIPLLTEFICAAPVNIVTDLAILALPIPVLTGMYLPSRQKTILVLTFALGVFVAIVDVVRIYYLQQAIVDVPIGGATSDPRSRFGGELDFAYNASISLMWSAVEANVGMMCACVPTLKPLVLRLLPAILYEPGGSRGDQDSRRMSAQVAGRATTPKGPTQAFGTRSSSNGMSVLEPPEPAFRAQHQQRRGTMMAAAAPRSSSFSGRSPPPPSPPPPPPPPSHPETPLGQPDSPDRFLRPPLSPALVPARSRTNPTTMTAMTVTMTMTMTMTATMTTSTECSHESGIYFGFVNMTKPKSMLRANQRDSIKYCTIVAILFVLWGISYGLLNTLNDAVAAISGMGTAEALGLTSAYFGGGYLFGPLLVGEWLLRRDEHSRSRRHRRNDSDYIGGYKVTFIVGLCIYGTGTIIFWPSAVTASYGGFMLSNFVAGFGLSVLEVAANSFMVLCGPAEYGEVRLLVAQASQAVGSVLSGLLAEKVFFKSLGSSTGSVYGGSGNNNDNININSINNSSVNNININIHNNSRTLLNVQWTYLGITLLCVALALLFYYMPLPEVGDGELEEAAKQLPVDPCKRSVGGLQLRTVSLVLAVVTQYVYVGGQEANSAFFRSLLVSVLPGQPRSGLAAAGGTLIAGNGSNKADRPRGFAITLSDSMTVGHTAFAIGRFVASYLAYLSVVNPRVPKPRTVLGVSVGVCLACALAMVLADTENPNVLFAPNLVFFLFEGPIWPLLFAIGLRGQGRRTKRAAAFITMGASGPAFIPFIMYGIIARGGSVQLSYVVVVVISLMMVFYPIFLTFVRDARLLVDACPDKMDVAAEQQGTSDEGEGGSHGGDDGADGEGGHDGEGDGDGVETGGGSGNSTDMYEMVSKGRSKSMG